LIAFDTSVAIAAFASWHEAHAGASTALARRPRLPAQVFIETYSVLTRLPPPHRATAAVVEQFLRTTFPEAPLTLPGGAYRRLVEAAAGSGIAGGAIYDALIGLTAKRANAKLLTLDRRAVAAYEAVGVRYELLG
jgi:predicted nucleic acid-binding protein